MTQLLNLHLTFIRILPKLNYFNKWSLCGSQ
ncbi:hypothetical protein FHT12_001808 [Xanthomonas campestris]|nr:hypothetical protein [Xanthomonas euroxanthea]SYZ57863.1 hypothetical protein CPBF367_41460 [Xanthomonas arboricola pv. juglandis]